MAKNQSLSSLFIGRNTTADNKAKWIIHEISLDF